MMYNLKWREYILHASNPAHSFPNGYIFELYFFNFFNSRLFGSLHLPDSGLISSLHFSFSDFLLPGLETCSCLRNDLQVHRNFHLVGELGHPSYRDAGHHLPQRPWPQAAMSNLQNPVATLPPSQLFSAGCPRRLPATHTGCRCCPPAPISDSHPFPTPLRFPRMPYQNLNI